MERVGELSLTLVAMVVLAGVAGATLLTVDGQGRAGADPATETPDVSQQGAQTPPPTVADRPNPWNESQLTVAINASAAEDRDVEQLVRSAAAFWSNHSETYAGYAVTFTVESEVSNPDIVVRFSEEVTDCGSAEHAAGCTKFINNSEQIERPEVVRIQTGLSNASAEHVIRHEFGHLLGIEHNAPPTEVMRPDAELNTLPQPNATRRAFPWADKQFRVYLDLGAAPDEAAARRQVQSALAYYERGPERMPEGIRFTLVENRSAADIVISYKRNGSCSGGSGACFQSRGPDPDGDGAIERYSHATITLYGVDTDTVGWHVGNWLAYAFGAEAESRRPPPFRHASPAERRSNWWGDDEE
jgi:predicted Zn-dependent protease